MKNDLDTMGGISNYEIQCRIKEQVSMYLKIPDTEPHICKHFGCGKVLSLFELLFGNKCPEHSKLIFYNERL